MVPAWSLRDVCRDIEARFERDGFETDAVKMIGFLFARPQSRLGRSEIVPNLGYFHHRAGAHIHFFCAGYGAYWPPGTPSDAEHVVTIEKTKWLYSDELFNTFRRELEDATRWRYNGDSELLLTNSVWNARDRAATLDFSSSLAMNLDEAIADGAIPSVGNWFEEIFRFAENDPASDDPTLGFGIRAGRVAARHAIVEMVLKLLPRGTGSEAKKLPHFLVTDLAG